MSSIHTTCLPLMLLSGWVFGCYFYNCRIHLFLTNDVRGGDQKTACLYIVHQGKSSDSVDIFTLTHTQQPPRFNHLKKVSYFLSDRTISPNSELRCCTVCFTDDINKWIIPNDSAPPPLKAALVISESATGSVKQEHETSPKNNWISGENFRILLIYFPHSGTDLTLMLMLSAVCCLLLLHSSSVSGDEEYQRESQEQKNYILESRDAELRDRHPYKHPNCSSFI